MSGGDGGGTSPPTGAERPGAGTPRTRGVGAGSRSVSALIDAVFADPDDTAGEAADPSDLQSVLTAAVRDLARRTATPRVCAWLAREHEAPMLAAAHWTEGNAPTPDAETLAALRALDRPTDLAGAGADTALVRFGLASGLAAAVAVTPEESATVELAPVVLAVGGPDDLPGHARPRTLAMLGDVAERLRGPLATSLALSRLARLDDAVRGLDRQAALGELVAEIVHEVRNPLVSVKTFLQLLPSRLDDPEFLEDFRGIVVDEVGRLERLLDSVLQHAAPSPDDETRGVASVADVFDRVARLLDHRASDRRIRLVHAADPSVDEVLMPRDGLRQVVLNLALNALDAAPAGGTVWLVAHAQAVADGRWVEVRVEDDGPGIAPDDRLRIFEAFHSTQADRPGGLGLAISRRLVETAGGSIRAGDREGGGAAISVRLPAAPRL